MIMTVQVVRGDLLKQHDVDAIVNTVNCVGVMGKGIALQFRNKWPTNFEAYERACKAGEVRLGRMFVFDAGAYAQPHYIINFPTKKHWRGKSQLSFIKDGLVDLVAQVRQLEIRSIAVPPLGCGNGGLEWSDVRPLIEEAFAQTPEVGVRLFEPVGAPEAKTMEVRTTRPRMTAGRAAILKLIETYRELNYGLSKIEVQKLAYFLQSAGEDLKLHFAKHHFGPYSDELRHALNRMEGHFIVGMGDGTIESEIEPVSSALAEAEAFVAEHSDSELEARIERVRKVIEGFQSPYGMELLASVHWVTAHEPGVDSLGEAVAAVHEWNARKQKLLEPAHIEAAWQRLRTEGWIPHDQTVQTAG